MSSSSSVQFKLYLCNQVGDIAGNEVSPTKQARGDNGKEPKLHRWQNGENNLWRKQAQRQFLSGQKNLLFVPTAAKSDFKGSTGSSGLFPMAV